MPAASEMTCTTFEGLHNYMDALYANHHGLIQETGRWIKIPHLFLKAASSYSSYWIYRATFALPLSERVREWLLERILDFAREI